MADFASATLRGVPENALVAMGMSGDRLGAVMLGDEQAPAGYLSTFMARSLRGTGRVLPYLNDIAPAIGDAPDGCGCGKPGVGRKPYARRRRSDTAKPLRRRRHRRPWRWLSLRPR